MDREPLFKMKLFDFLVLIKRSLVSNTLETGTAFRIS
jgi:hypothetical protein